MMKGPKRIQVILQIAVFLVLVVVLGGITAFRYADYKINDRAGEYNNNIEALTEYETVTDEDNADKKNGGGAEPVARKKTGSTLEAEVATTFFGKQEILDINGEVRKELGQYFMNDVYKLNNGHLTEMIDYRPDEELAKLADNIASVKGFLDGQGIPMIFVMAPFSMAKYDPQLPGGVEIYANDNADRFVAFLRERGVEVLDVRDAMYEDGIDHYDMFYRTDHHWTTAAGFYTYQKLEPWLAEHVDFVPDPRVGDLSNYTVQTWPEWHLGSYGQKTGIEFAEGADDFTLFIPNFDTQIEEFGIDGSGRLEDMFYHMEYLQEKDYESRLTYDNVLGAGDLYGKICYNTLVNNEIDMLFISNSFYRALYPYLLMQFRQVRYTHDATVEGLTPDNMLNYDVVLILFEPTLLYDGCGAFKFTGY